MGQFQLSRRLGEEEHLGLERFDRASRASRGFSPNRYEDSDLDLPGNGCHVPSKSTEAGWLWFEDSAGHRYRLNGYGLSRGRVTLAGVSEVDIIHDMGFSYPCPHPPEGLHRRRAIAPLHDSRNDAGSDESGPSYWVGPGGRRLSIHEEDFNGEDIVFRILLPMMTKLRLASSACSRHSTGLSG